MSGLIRSPTTEAAPSFRHGEEMVATQRASYKRKYGDNLERCVVVFQNANFDALILSRRYGIHPPHVIDVLALSRHWHARSKHDLGTQAKRYDLEEKGETEDFKGLTFKRASSFPRAARKGRSSPSSGPSSTRSRRHGS
jgi:hypothetical protein